MQHIVCFSGGHSSALVALAVVGRHGCENVMLLNHDIHPDKEDADFKREVAAHLGLSVTYANIHDLTDEQQLPDTLESTRQVGIEQPLTCGTYKHGNCAGCLKRGIQHWYVTFCHRPDVYAQAEAAEAALGYTINRSRAYKRVRPLPLTELRPVFAQMLADGIPTTEHYPNGKFSWDLRRYQLEAAETRKPCECSF
jgi:hypothetical protein